MTTRLGGVSHAPFDSLNVGTAVGDDPAAVAENRRRVQLAAGVPVAWVRQVHGVTVVRAADALRSHNTDTAIEADAVWTDQPGQACAVQVADCMPVLMAARNGRAVAAAHAGWRGLAAGVVESALAAVAAAAGCAPADIRVWLGPCIGPRHFEVGADVLEAFGQSPVPADLARFVFRPRADRTAAWLADLPGLARDRLAAAGVSEVTGGRWCTVEDASRFFSFRRDRLTGRLVALIWIRG